MAASEEAYGDNHPATLDTYQIPNGTTRQRAKMELPRIAQLSEIAHGEGDETIKGFPQPRRPESHDYGADN